MTHRLLPGMVLGRRNFGRMVAGAAATASFGLPFAARAQDVRVVRLAHHVTVDSAQHAAAEDFAARVAEYSGGAIEVQILPAAQMGGQREIIESVALGVLEMGYGESGLYANYVPQFGVVALPYLYRDFAHWEAMADGEVGASLAQSLQDQAGIRLLNWMTGGHRDTYLQTKPINTPADFQGVKIRLPEAPVFVQTFSRLGALPTPVPAPEMYTALQTGLVDAMEGTPEVGYTFKIYEVTRYLSKTRHLLNDGSFAINAAFFEGLSADEQEALSRAATEAATAQRADHFRREAQWFERLVQDSDLEVNEPDLAPFQEILGGLQDELAASSDATDLLAAIRDL